MDLAHSDLVLFQPTATTLALPLAEFDNPDKAVELTIIRLKLAQSSFLGGSK